jgi:uncharacterized FlaG/YvyC family protein
MAITPIQGSPSLPGIQPPSDESARSHGQDGPDRAAARAASLQPKTDAKPDLEELRTVTAQSGLEVRFDTLKGSNVTLIRIVDPATGKVVREFPPERLARVLAEIRAEATAHLNKRSIDRRA